MHGKSQANHLASLMQKHHCVSSYELTLPFVTVKSLSLDRLKVDDILLLRQKIFKCILLKNNTIVAEMMLLKKNNRYVLSVATLVKRKISKTRRKSYEVLKLSLGEVYSRILEVDRTIELSHIDVHKVTLKRKDKIIAEALLVNVDEEIALQIDKVI